MFNKEDVDRCVISQKENERNKQSIMTELKRLILSHQRLNQLRKPRQEYIANQLLTVFCKGKKLKTALREIHQSCGERTKVVAAEITEDLALHLAKVTALPDEL